MAQEGDVVLVHIDGSPAFFARVESITMDVKPGWFHVKMLVFQVPLIVITWILRQAYIDGDEFTMGGRPMRLEKVVAPPEEQQEPDAEQEETGAGEKAPSEPPVTKKVVSLMDRRKKDHSS